MTVGTNTSGTAWIVVATVLLFATHHAFGQENPIRFPPGSVNPASVKYPSPSIIPGDVFNRPGSIFNSGLNNSGFNITRNSQTTRRQNLVRNPASTEFYLSRPAVSSGLVKQPQTLRSAATQAERFFKNYTNGQGWIDLFKLNVLKQIDGSVSPLADTHTKVLDLVERRFRWLETQSGFEEVLW